MYVKFKPTKENKLAVFTKLSFEEIKLIFHHYEKRDLVGHKEISAGTENTNYLIWTEDKKYILTIFEKRVNKRDLPFYLNLMNYLKEQNFPCPRVLKEDDDTLTFTYKAKTGCITTFMEGSEPEKITTTHCMKLGEKLAEFHLKSENFSIKRENDFSIFGTKKLYQELKIKKLIEETEQILFKEIFNKLENADYNNLKKGIIHADLFPDNVFFNESLEISGIIDFYFSCNDYLIYDLAICINAWCFDDNNKLDNEKFNQLINSYQNIRKLEEQEKNHLKNFCLLAAIRFFLTRTQDLENKKDDHLVTLKDPKEYLEKIKFLNCYEKNNHI